MNNSLFIEESHLDDNISIIDYDASFTNIEMLDKIAMKMSELIYNMISDLDDENICIVSPNINSKFLGFSIAVSNAIPFLTLYTDKENKDNNSTSLFSSILNSYISVKNTSLSNIKANSINNIILIIDVLYSGQSCLEFIKFLQFLGLNTIGIITLIELDSYGGKELLNSNNIQVSSYVKK